MQWIQCGYRTPNRLPGNSRGLWTECGSVWKRIKCRVCTYCHFTSLHGWRIICFLLSCIYNQEFSVYYCMLLISPVCDKVQGNAVHVWFSLNESTGNIGMFVILALFTKTQIENKRKYTGFNSKLQIHYIREKNTRGPAKVYQGVSCQLSVQTHIGTHLSFVHKSGAIYPTVLKGILLKHKGEVANYHYSRNIKWLIMANNWQTIIYSPSCRVLVGAPLQRGDVNETGKLYRCQKIQSKSGSCQEVTVQSKCLADLLVRLQQRKRVGSWALWLAAGAPTQNCVCSLILQLHCTGSRHWPL